MPTSRNIELLSPAKNLDVGIAAINHGADAVYIGPSNFGARVAAGNSLMDIEKLVEYAHKFYARIYVTMNTILKDEELESARSLVNDLYNIGVDALIIQDMSFLMMDIPPIALHASTQCDTRTIDKVRFLEKCGFEQVVLARETPICMMKQMSKETNVKLEAFVHGALCVSYSGQCYMSEAMRGRSANRGACAQMCRLPYDLFDDKGNTILKNKHLLSLKDFDASRHLNDMINAGITSFKIEGRLKNESYVKNITAYYRKLLDNIFEENSNYKASSSGHTNFYFNPNPQKTFYRGSTDYFLDGRKRNIWSLNTPKSLGEPIGKVKDIWRNALSVNTKEPISNGDGLCFLNKKDEFEGFRVNRVEGIRLLPLKMPNIEKGTLLYRNLDVSFERLLMGKTAERKIKVCIEVIDIEEGFKLQIRDEDGIETHLIVNYDHVPSDNKERVISAWEKQFSKLGDTIFSCSSVIINKKNDIWFVPISILADWRRQLVCLHELNRQKKYIRSLRKINNTSHHYVTDSIDYHGNVYNQLAEEFYFKHHCRVTQKAFESEHYNGVELMRTKHCIRYALGMCLKNDQNNKYRKLYIKNGDDVFELIFDCHNCEMIIKQKED